MKQENLQALLIFTSGKPLRLFLHRELQSPNHIIMISQSRLGFEL